ncbi:zinc finger protein 814 [Aplysia californica]|uniref:Zinc finger protein 814 n=1 Tax=Aplysia californica TaxID=6500 RepID=A0ABM0JT94_APLCA|nr:zinc finger protein 814 [Aplysia californica]
MDENWAVVPAPEQSSFNRELFLSRLVQGASQFLDLLHESLQYESNLSSLNVICDVVKFLQTHSDIPDHSGGKTETITERSEANKFNSQCSQTVVTSEDIDRLGIQIEEQQSKRKTAKTDITLPTTSKEPKPEEEDNSGEQTGVRKSRRIRKIKNFKKLYDDDNDEDFDSEDEDYTHSEKKKQQPASTKKRRGRPPGSSQKSVRSSAESLPQRRTPAPKKNKPGNRCELCSMSFTRCTGLQLHLRTHMTTDPLQCGICKKSFVALKGLANHVSSHQSNTEMEKISCWICEESYYNISTHLLDHAEFFKYKCDFCAETFTDLLEMNEHWASHREEWLASVKDSVKSQVKTENYNSDVETGDALKSAGNLAEDEKPFTKSSVMCKCIPCKMMFPSALELKIHSQEMHSNRKVKPVQCKICKKYFSSIQVLASHALKHKDKKACWLCGVTCKHLSIHMKVHETDFDFGCGECEKIFPTIYLLHGHQMSKHVQERPHECDICHKTFKLAHGLTAHKRTHQAHRTPSYECKSCGRHFYSRSGRSTHKCKEEEGAEESTLICQICGKIYRDNIFFTNHIESNHSAETDLVCEFCDEVLPTTKDLISHRNFKHLEEVKPFHCVPCGLTFTKLLELTEHLKKNNCTAESQCEDCGKSFTRKFEYKLHSHVECLANKVIATPKLDSVHQCKICFRNFSLFSSLAFHSTRHARNRVCWVCGKVCKHLSIHMRQHYDLFEFSCTKCDKKFPTKSQLQSHEACHMEKSPYVCDICDRSFGRAHRLKLHKMTHETNRRRDYFCEMCGKFFYSKKSLSTHRTSHMKERDKEQAVIPLTCQICGRNYRNEIYLTNHLDNAHKEEKDLVCDFCDMTLSTTKELISHRNLLHLEEENPYHCSFCGDVFATVEDLLGHLRSHEGYCVGNCDSCGLSFNRKFDLKVHSLSHLPREVILQKLGNAEQQETCPFRCQVCGKKFTRNFAYESHFHKHNMFELAYCDYCDQSFQDSKEMLDHRRKMHNDQPNPYICSLCGQGFDHSAKLVDHLYTHPERNLYSCNKCQMTFSRQFDLAIHKFDHNWTRFFCDLCPRSYASRGSLVTHMKNHSGNFDHKCDYCDKRFKTGSEVRIHHRTHTREQPYSCRYCGKRFSRSSTKVSHERIHTDERPYPCNICGSAFRLGSTLKKHQKRVHRDIKVVSKQFIPPMEADQPPAPPAPPLPPPHSVPEPQYYTEQVIPTHTEHRIEIPDKQESYVIHVYDNVLHPIELSSAVNTITYTNT